MFLLLEIVMLVPETLNLLWQVSFESGQTKAGALELIVKNGEKKES